jgi:leucyl aminopeptidase
MVRCFMNVTATTDAPRDTAADTVAIGVFEDEGVAHDTSGGDLQALLDAGEAKGAFKHLAVVHADGKRWLLAGLGKRDDFNAERARVAAAGVQGRAGELGARSLCWEVPHHVGDEVAGALVEGTVLADYRFERYKKRDDEDDPPARIGELLVAAHHDLGEAVDRAAIVAAAANAARDLQNTPANDMTPSRLAERARELEGVEVEVEGREGIEARGMGAFACVAQGTHTDPALITIRYEGPDARGPVLGLVGKAVTFDSGGISIKPGAKMADMKFDMSGGAAVLEAVGAIARLQLPVRVVAVIGATENLPSGHAVKPGDIVRSMHERRGGAIVNVASEAGRVGSQGSVTYSAAKAGVIGFTRAIARESARYRVRSNAVAPGPIETPLLNSAPQQLGELGERLKQGMINGTLLQRIGAPEEVAAAIAFLASDDASFVTGQTINVSGGMSMA